MTRREFLKIGLLTIPSVYWFPSRLLNLIGRDTPRSSRSFNHGFCFAGRHYGEIRDNRILMPESFISSLIGTQIHFAARKGSGYLMLIPGDASLKGVIKREIRELTLTKPYMKILYIPYSGRILMKTMKNPIISGFF